MEGKLRYNPDTGKRWSERPSEPETVDNTVFYSVLRQQGARVEQISFVLKSQHHHALPVHEIQEMHYHPERGIRLFCGFALVHIEGRQLKELYRLLVERRVKEIREFSDQAEAFFATDALFISRIRFESENMERLGV